MNTKTASSTHRTHPWPMLFCEASFFSRSFHSGIVPVQQWPGWAEFVPQPTSYYIKISKLMATTRQGARLQYLSLWTCRTPGLIAHGSLVIGGHQRAVHNSNSTRTSNSNFSNLCYIHSDPDCFTVSPQMLDALCHL